MENIKNNILDILKNIGIKEPSLDVPPKENMGDYAFPCFALAKEQKKSPMEIAKEIDLKLKGKLPEGITTKIIGPYLNFFINQNNIADNIIKEILELKNNYGTKPAKKDIVLVESPGPNTNKPLHLGHLRNILLGNSITKILKTQGKQVHIVNIVNDRGVHICKSMLAYKKWGNNETPESKEIKSDHFVGDYYVKYSKEEKNNPEIENEVQEMLIKWESGDKETIVLWKQMNSWALEGFNQTYAKLNFKPEKEYFESNSYIKGKEIILEGVKKDIFQKNKEGATIVNLEDKGLGEKILLRSNGTSVYITQDLYVAKKRYEDYNFDEMIYVVGNEQEYHFKVLFEIFKILGWSFGDKCHHFSYGMIELPEGKMKSREGTVVDTDDLIEEVTNIAKEEVKNRYNDIKEDEINKRAETIAKAGIKFFFLKFDPVRNFIFNPKESISFEGETGPYVQYSYARICSIFKKLEKEIDIKKADLSLLNTEPDKRILKLLANYPSILEASAKNYKPSTLCHYLIDLASCFNGYYRDNPILKADENTMIARLALCECVKIVIRSGLDILGINVLEQM
jgi:arginyl-tRNA synthetase